jgi:hypothetical protein
LTWYGRPDIKIGLCELIGETGRVSILPLLS